MKEEEKVSVLIKL